MSDLPGDDFRKFHESRLAAYFATALPGVPVKFGEAPIKQPKDSMWIQVWNKPDKSFQCNLGGRRFTERTPGAIQIDVYVPARTGHATADRAAEAAARLFAHNIFPFEGNQVARFRGALVGPKDGGTGWYCCCARIGYEHDAPIVVAS